MSEACRANDQHVDMSEARAQLPPRTAADLGPATEAAQLLYRAGARRVWICGSLAHGQHWDAASDLDFATTGLPAGQRVALTGVLSERTGRAVDVIDLDDAPPFLRVQIMQAMIPIDRFGRTAPATRGLLNPPVTTLTHRPLPRGLHARRHAAVLEVLRDRGSRDVLDLGCGTGEFVAALAAASDDASRVAGLDPDRTAVAAARERVATELPGGQRQRVRIGVGGVDDLERRWRGHDALVAIEVIEHLDPPVLRRLDEILFRRLRPATIVVTTPNADFNALLPGRGLRHPDHRFEWTRPQFAAWARARAESGGYRVRITGVGESHPECGAPSQLVAFTRGSAA
ncbi:methyltransferase domain-containing protein [Nakamurella sp.]|uniref:methyltransferase domain-containing protein n=1 Tax=Nakamurella sp. TaxID=1869182 RepID=UPI003783544A